MTHVQTGWIPGCVNCFVPGTQVGDGGLRVDGHSTIFVDVARSRLRIDFEGNLSQPVRAGGAVKATVLVMPEPIHGVLSIFRCFNSTLAAVSESIPPCGFTLDRVGVGDYIINFGFKMDDRFISATPVVAGNTISVCTTETSCPNLPRFDPNEVEVQSMRNGSFADTNFYLIIY